mmetsp:Transcript_28253/g.60208  ORF Transcript_28253/g.60208 Transcript_28253/m.60208 type:complete len:99 (+) Transcript_28253:3-299(+)
MKSQVAVKNTYYKITKFKHSSNVFAAIHHELFIHLCNACTYFSSPLIFLSRSFNPELPQSFQPTPLTVLYARVAGRRADPSQEPPAAGPANLATATGT